MAEVAANQAPAPISTGSTGGPERGSSQRLVHRLAVGIVEAQRARRGLPRDSTEQYELRRVPAAIGEMRKVHFSRRRGIAFDCGWRGRDQEIAALVVARAQAGYGNSR